MAASITGKAGTFTIDGVLNGKCVKWTLNISSTNKELSASGDDATERIHIRKDWKAVVTLRMLNQAVHQAHLAQVGSNVAISLYRASTDSLPVFSDTGLITEVDHPVNAEGESDAIDVEITVECSRGTMATGSTINTSVG